MFFRFILTASVCITLCAQTDRGIVTGTVADPQGGVVPQAKVGLRNTQTGSQYETITTPTGNYSLGQLPAGTYDLSVEFAGFKKFTQQGIVVQVAQTERVDVALAVGSTADTVTITADATLLKTETAEQSYNIATERINALPLNFSARGPGSFRDPFAFVQLVPGANITDRNNIRVNGQPNATFAIRLEGQDTSRPLDPLNSDMVAPSVESLHPKAWQDAPAGQWGVSAAYYNDYRQQRRPDEQLSLGRTFRVREGVTFSLRGEFFNAFNRTVLAAPSFGNPTSSTTTDSRGLSGGFGFINGLNSGTPRNGQVVLRLQF